MSKKRVILSRCMLTNRLLSRPLKRENENAGVTVSFLRSTNIILVLVCQCFFLTNTSFAHPASGIVVDAQGHVYFIYSGHGVMQIDPPGKLTNTHEDKGQPLAGIGRRRRLLTSETETV